MERRYTSQGVLQVFRFKSKGTGLALVGDAPLGVDQIQTIRPACVGLVSRIAEFVQHGGNLYAKFSHACPRHERAFLFAFWTGKNNVLFHIALHLPNVTRVRFGDVDHEESDLACILFVELVKGGNLPPEWRSSVAPKDQHHRLVLSCER